MEYKNIKIDPSSPRRPNAAPDIRQKHYSELEDIPTLAMDPDDCSDPEQPAVLHARSGTK